MSFSHRDIVSVFHALHNREPDADFIALAQASGDDIGALVRLALKGGAPKSPPYALSEGFFEHNGPRFGVPRELRVTPTPLKRVLLVGSCLLSVWPQRLKRLGIAAEVDHVLLTITEAPVTPHPVDAYSFQVTQIGNRSIIPDLEMFAWARAPMGDVAPIEKIFGRIKWRLDRLLPLTTSLRDQIPIFVANFPRPQQELNGRLIDQRAIDSVFGLYEKINSYLREAVVNLKNVYILDIVDVFAQIGRKHLLDDSVTVSTHASIISNSLHEHDKNRIVPVRPPPQYYDVKLDDFIQSVWFEAEAMYRTLRQIDQVKMICVDLDDTLWRGVLAEAETIEDIDVYVAIEGWPVGLAEALLILKRRGVLLCIVSKNTEDRVRAIFEKVYRNRLTLDDFAIVKINWASKAENIRAAMAEANLLPRSVVFLDDNPLERAAVKQVFPEIRIIDAPLHYWRRILLWSAETQSPVMTAESGRRTEMVQAQVKRESMRAEATRPEEFLASLDLKVEIAVAPREGARFNRALELLNKSNQFNTNGRRWSAQELAAVAEDGAVVVAAVSDKFADYGDTLVAIVRGDRIEQLVMSCRVVSLGVELAAVAVIARRVLAGHPRISAKVVETDANVLARDLYRRCGWNLADDEWSATSPSEPPGHVTVVSAF